MNPFGENEQQRAGAGTADTRQRSIAGEAIQTARALGTKSLDKSYAPSDHQKKR